MRDIPGWAIYFYSYELYKVIFRHDALKVFHNNNHPQRREFIIDLIAGGMAGVSSWAIGYPFDIIKTHM
jgi:hypothetical protein